MGDQVPVVYLLHGEDEYSISNFVRILQEKLGDPSMAEMNTTRLEDGGFNLEELRAAASAVPFLTSRRLVILETPTRKVKLADLQKKFISMLENLPETTALVLLENKTLPEKNWLLKWAQGAEGRAYIRAYPVPKGAQMVEWIRKCAIERGGEINHQAASLLAEMVGNEPRMAALEVEKLLAYVKYARPVDIDDVDNLAAFAGGQGDFFKMIDAIARQDGRNAMAMLHRLLDEQVPLSLFFSLVGHFRLLLQTREVYEVGGQDGTVAKELSIHPYRAKKLTAQARTMSMATLEGIYYRLQEYDLKIKTGQLEAELALETLIASLTAQPT
jgi:DNA polymerase-3 subunit delta